MFEPLIVLHIIALGVLFLELLYVIMQSPSKEQLVLQTLLISTSIMLLGYIVEIFATTLEGALYGIGFSYIGKPFALMSTLVFVMYYCKINIKNWVIGVWCLFNAIFPILIFTNDYHHLYYATVSYAQDATFSHISLSRGPMYYLYLIYILFTLGGSIYLTVKKMIKAKSKIIRHQCLFIIGMIASVIIGYLLYIFDLTGGFDTTMTGSVVGSALILILFVKYHLFDTITYAKEKAIDNSSSALVVSSNEEIVYKNAKIREIVQQDFKLSDILALTSNDKEVEGGGRWYEVKVETFSKNGNEYGKAVELTDVTERHNYNQVLRDEVASRTEEIQKIQRSFVASFASIVEARDNSTGTHVRRMQKIVEMLAHELVREGYFVETLTENYINVLVEVAPLHDIGKISIRDNILLKPGKLTAEEFEIMKTHTIEGKRIISECLGGVENEDYVKMAEEVALYHHEWWDGTGYPLNAKSNDIPLCARIVAIADVYDAVRSERCYKKAMLPDEAREEMERGNGKHFDPFIMKAFYNLLPEIEKLN